MSKGFITILLHAHLPFVNHPEEERAFEERWFYESLTECYLPLLKVLEEHRDKGIRSSLTISLSSTLLSMFQETKLKDGYIKYLDNLISLGQKEVNHKKGQELALAEYYLSDICNIKEFYLEVLNGDLISAFRTHFQAGRIELITCAGTHGFLPLMLTDTSIRNQIESAVEYFVQLFGARPRGMWLPECGYFPGLESFLREAGIQYIFVDTVAFEEASPRPSEGVMAPVLIGECLAAFARNPKTAEQVWSSYAGYPGDYDYREYYRDIGFDAPWNYIKEFLHPVGFRHNTGFKYYRVTGKDKDKEFYDRENALRKATEHAQHFTQLSKSLVRDSAASSPIVVCPFDAELFGHWWYEGPQWLDQVICQLQEDNDLQLVTPSEYLGLYQPIQSVALTHSTWGEDSNNKVWLNPRNDWIYRELHHLEEIMKEAAYLYGNGQVWQRETLELMLRQMMLAQSSDWAFIIYMETTVGYAERRVKEHVTNFHLLNQSLRSGPDTMLMQYLQKFNNIFPGVSLLEFWETQASPTKKGLMKVLVLSWEFPPKTVGGLARHVGDLSKAFSQQEKVELHIITTSVPNSPEYEVVEGVHIHRLSIWGVEEDFLPWVFQMNLAMIRYSEQLNTKVGGFEVIHAHDWLVGLAALELKAKIRVPLVTTIHATERGRNQGIHSDIQHKIHNIEVRLANHSDRVICCSQYMSKEVSESLGVPLKNITVIPNGVAIENLQPKENTANITRFGDYVLYVGRLVREKGVQTLIRSMETLWETHPEAQCLIAGKGPMLEELRTIAYQTSRPEQIKFLGFVDDDLRNELLANAKVAVFPSLYEPFGIVALEAMAAHTPLVVSDVGGLGEIITHKVNGLKVPPDEPKVLGEAIKYLIENPSESRSMALLAEMELRTIYDWKRIAEDTFEVYEKVRVAVF